MRAQRLPALDVLVDGAGAEVAAARHGDLRPAEAAQQRADEVVAGANLPRLRKGRARLAHLAAIELPRRGPDPVHLRTHTQQDINQVVDVGNIGDVFNAALSLNQQRRGDNGNRGVFRAADGHGAG